jgi:hypothetical protein
MRTKGRGGAFLALFVGAMKAPSGRNDAHTNKRSSHPRARRARAGRFADDGAAQLSCL